MSQKHSRKFEKGYTIIETMVSISIFLVVVVIGMGTLLSANVLHKKSQSMRSIMDNLNFITEEMARNIKTGYDYRCIGTPFSSTSIEVPQSCTFGRNIAFEYTYGDTTINTDQWVYKIESTDGGLTYNLSKSIASGDSASWVQLNPDEVDLSSASGFSVLGAPDPSSVPSDTQQPFVIIRLVGSITLQGVVTPFSIETAVSQRLVDI